LMVRIFLTGPPRCGKTTVLLKVVEELRKRGLKVGGITTPEVREAGRRVGFRVVDLYTGASGRLAWVGLSSRFRVGKYGVDLEDFERVAVPALERAVSECDVVCVDEIGKMELYSRKFEEALAGVFKSEKPVVATLHRTLVNRYRHLGEVVWVTPENRDQLPGRIVQKVLGGVRA